MIEHISEEDFNALEAAIEASKAARTAKMPTETAALAQMFEAWQRLQEMGWKEAQYCPKDGSHFSAIEAGSTGIHDCNYLGAWPDGAWWIYDGDMWPARPVLWRPRKPEDPNVNLGTAMEYDCQRERP